MNSKLISTRNVDVVLAKQKRLERVTTKIDHASIKANKLEEDLMKSQLISTHNIGSVAEVEEKKERDEILAQRKSFKKGDPVHLNEDGILVANEKEEKTIEKHMKDIDGKVFKTTEDMNLDMRDEKKIAMAERMEKVREGKEKKETP